MRGGGEASGGGAAGRKLTDNAQARAALAARRRRREEEQQQQAAAGGTAAAERSARNGSIMSKAASDAGSISGATTSSSRPRRPGNAAGPPLPPEPMRPRAGHAPASQPSRGGGTVSSTGVAGSSSSSSSSSAPPEPPGPSSRYRTPSSLGGQSRRRIYTDEEQQRLQQQQQQQQQGLGPDTTNVMTNAKPSNLSSPMSTVKSLLSSVSADFSAAPTASTGDRGQIPADVDGGVGIAAHTPGYDAGASAVHLNDGGGSVNVGGSDIGYRIRRVDLDRKVASTNANDDYDDDDDDDDAVPAAADGTAGAADNMDASADWSVWSDNGDVAGDDEVGGGDEVDGVGSSMAGRDFSYSYLRPGESDCLDATCITYGSSVVVRVMTAGDGWDEVASISAAVDDLAGASSSSSASASSPKRSCDAVVVTDGTGVGLGEQVLTLLKAYGVSVSLNSSSSPDVLRYGDFVSLQSPYARKRSLGIRKSKGSDGANNDDGHHQHDEIGFYRTVRGQAERWEVLPARGGAPVAVGSDAALAAAAAASRGGGGDVTDERRRTVRSGDPVVLRNVQTGGLLSLSGHSTITALRVGAMSSPNGSGGRSLSIITSSYQMASGGGASTGNDRTLLDFLHHHDQVRPSPLETFRITQASVPSCPSWLVDSSHCDGEAQDAILGARPYLDGTYLLHPGRDDDLRAGPTWSTFSFDDTATSSSSLDKQTHQNLVGESLAKQPVQVQEQVLLDEVLGSMMGLEGRFIRSGPSKSHDQGEVKEDTSSSTSEMQMFRFVLAPYSIVGGPVDTSLRHIISRILPLSSNFVVVNSFVSSRLGRYEYGMVAHALAEAMDLLLQEYLAFATHMEALYLRRATGLTLSKLFVLVQASVRTMEVLRRSAGVVASLKGGALLNAVTSLMEDEFLGDAKAQEVLSYLLDNASIPYLAMLRGWLDNGTLIDSYGEFMVERAPEGEQLQDTLAGNTSGDNWIHWFIARDENVLSSLSLTGREREVAVDKVLTTGKYWNAVHLCTSGKILGSNSSKHDADDANEGVGGSTSMPEDSSSNKVTMTPIELSSYIDQSYKAASQELRCLILREYQLVNTLRVMKRYFLLDQGDFFVHFLDMAEAELLKEVTEVSRGRIQSWLSMSVQPSTGIVSARPSDFTRSMSTAELMASSLRANFATESLVERLDDLHANSGGIRAQEARTPSRHLYGAINRGLTGIEAFMLDFQYVPFPISLVLSHRAITSYQLLFRHLFFVKHVERRLVGTWLDHQSMKEFQSLRHSLGPTFGLRHRMLHFIQNLVYYMMFEVIEPKWQSMEKEIVSGETGRGLGVVGKEKDPNVDDALIVHNEFLRRTLKDCLLTNGDLVRTLTKLMTTCLLFSDQMKLFLETTQINEERDRIAREERHKRQQNITIVSKRSRLRKTAKAEAASRKARWLEHAKRLEHELNTESYKRMISRFGQVFNNNLTDFMTQLRDTGDCSNLLARLDYNGFVSSSLRL